MKLENGIQHLKLECVSDQEIYQTCTFLIDHWYPYAMYIKDGPSCPTKLVLRRTGWKMGQIVESRSVEPRWFKAEITLN